MRKSLCLTIVLGLVLLLVGCSGNVNKEPLTDEQIIHKLLRNFEEAYIAKDIDAIVKLLVIPIEYDENWLTNEQEIRELFGEYFKGENIERFEFTDRSPIIFAYQNTRAGLYTCRIIKLENQDLELTNVSLEFVKENNMWKLSYCGEDD